MTETLPPSRRRWFQFGLRTMFVVVTVFAVWLAWELKAVRDRRDFLALIDAVDLAESKPMFSVFLEDRPPLSATPGTIPFWRLWLGDKPIEKIHLPLNWSHEQLEKTRSMFPEARVSQ
jgi:hypothetical protein